MNRSLPSNDLGLVVWAYDSAHWAEITGIYVSEPRYGIMLSSFRIDRIQFRFPIDLIRLELNHSRVYKW